MRSVIIALAALAGLSGVWALAQAPSFMDPGTGVRLGHARGVGASLPMSDKASNAGPADTSSQARVL